MAGYGDDDDNNNGSEEARETGCSFEWDPHSNLYFHASSGFYHDPTAGWYYSSRDGLYYTFEGGQYVLLPSNEDEESEAHHQCTHSVPTETIEDEPCISEHGTTDGMENHSRPSEWLEETLINLYLSGYSNSEVTSGSSSTKQTNEEEECHGLCEGLADHLTSDTLCAYHHGTAVQQAEEDEWIPENVQDAKMSSDNILSKDMLRDEENWLAQYGQVVRPGDESMPSFPMVDLWDWEMVTEAVKKRQKVARLIGRFVKQSSKLHPSVPTGGSRLKTASIRDVHLDLVRVSSGKVYRLRSPNMRYLASLSAYDSSNPTKDWGFPDLCVSTLSNAPFKFHQTAGSNISDSVLTEKLPLSPGEVPSTSAKQNTLAYRDRAAERRILHGGFGIGPGEKNFLTEESCPHSFDAEAASAEAINLAFGQGSYSRRILESMGWKDGEALGSSVKGILEPLQVVGNKGLAGLGWNHTR